MIILHLCQKGTIRYFFSSGMCITPPPPARYIGLGPLTWNLEDWVDRFYLGKSVGSSLSSLTSLPLCWQLSSTFPLLQQVMKKNKYIKSILFLNAHWPFMIIYTCYCYLSSLATCLFNSNSQRQGKFAMPWCLSNVS